MDTNQANPRQTLAGEIAELQAQMAQSVPAPALAIFQRSIEEVVRSGAGARSLKVGDHAPDCTLPDALGKPVALAGLLARGPVVVTFYRGEWCPYCNLTLRAYQRILPQVEALGATLVAISPQSPDNSLTTVEKKGLGFPVLSDAGNRVARAYGLVFAMPEELRALIDLPAFNGDASWELPVAGTFVLDRQGTVRLAFVDPDWTHRLEPEAILASLASLAAAPSRP